MKSSPNNLGGGSILVDPFLNDFRLSCDPSVPVTPDDRTAQSYLYATPFYKGNRITVLNENGNYRTIASAGATLAMTGLAAATNYDIVGKVNSAGELVLDSVVWTSDTARFYTLEIIEGRLAVNGYTLLGTIRTSGAAVIEDSKGSRFVSNLYNAVPRLMSVTEATASWTYTTDTYRAARASAANRLQVVRCVDVEPCEARVYVASANTTAGVQTTPGIGIDSTSASSALAAFGRTPPGASAIGIQIAEYLGLPGVGYHYLQWLEKSQATGTTTWYGSAVMTAGIFGKVWA